MKKVLFVCLGNICRSPMAEGVFLDLVDKNGLNDVFQVDSAGTAAYHIGKLADSRMRETAASHNIFLQSRARQVEDNDFLKFDYILAMDESNYDDLMARCPENPKAKIELMRNYDPQANSMSVPDPYYGGIAGFEEVYQILLRSCEVFLEKVK